MEDERLVLSLTVNPEDEAEIPENPYPFVMLPVLDYAVGEGRYPENAIRGGNLIFY